MSQEALHETLDRAWACMIAGAAPGKSRFSMAQVASIGLDGAPRARTVVIRDVDAEAREVTFHTDRRSPKVKELQADPRVAIIGYDMEAGLQVRIEGVARLHIGDSEAMTAWASSRDQSRIAYRLDHAPGTPLQDPKEGEASATARDPDDQKIGFHHFCRVTVKVTKIDWLDLTTSGHRRAMHQAVDEGWESAWVAP